MQINGNSDKYRLSNPILSKQNKSNPSFSGHTLTQDERGNDIYKFYIPNAPQNTKVQTVLLEKTEKGDFAIVDGTEMTTPLGENGIGVFRADKKIHDKNTAIGYKFLLGGSVPYYDYTKKTALSGDEKNIFCIATPNYRAGHTLPRQMEHVFPDSFTLDLTEEKRNHFNHLGGTIAAITSKLDLFKDFGIKRILGTPIFGQDTISSHGYWTSNGYQVTDTLGDIRDFRNLQTGLFKHGMGWVADGALVNEGLQGVHVKDILSRGTESPFVNWFSTTNIGDYGIQLGVLSKQADTNKHTHIKLINAPYRIEYEKTANGYQQQRVDKHSYDETKPTYIQIFDDRLVTPEQVNSDKVFKVYGKKNADDKHEINNYKDAVEPYAFRVTPRDVTRNYEKYQDVLKGCSSKGTKPPFKDNLTHWSNFEIVPANKDGGVGTWVGNTDIPKRRFMVSEKDCLGKTGEELKELQAAPYQVQDDTIQIGKFWTAETARTIIDYTASQISERMEKTSDYSKAITELVNEGKLPKAAELVNEGAEGSTPLDNILDYKDDGTRNYNLKPTVAPKTVTEGLMDLPLDAVEFSPDLTSILAYPYLKNYAVTEDTVGKSRYELFQMGDKFYNKMPNKYQALYKKMDAFISGKGSSSDNMTAKALELLRAAGAKAGVDLVDDKGELTEDGKEAYPLMATDIAKFIYVASISPDVKPRYSDNQVFYDTYKLQDTTIESLNLQYVESPEDAASQLLDIMKNGIKNIPSDSKKEFVDYLADKIQKLDPDTVNVAKLIVEKAEAGLDWRIDAAKDVGDWDAVDGRTLDEDICYEETAKFWTRFNEGIKKHNPKVYSIGELVLDMEHTRKREYADADFGRTFNNRTGFSTNSDYGFMYSSPFQLYGGELNDAGAITHNDDIVDKTIEILTTQGGGGSLFSSVMDTTNFAHVFMGNHDKPRILHLLGMDLQMFQDDKANNHFGYNDDKSTLYRANAMADVFDRAINHSTDFKRDLGAYEGVIRAAIDDLALGKYNYKGEEKQKEFDAFNFNTRAYDLNIDDVFAQAAQKDADFRRVYKTDPKKIAFVKAKLLETMLSPALTKAQAMTFYQIGMPGNPTIYAGDELGETGWETPCKNEYQQNRNRLHFERLTDDNYAYIKKYHSELKDIINIRNQEAASPLVNGATIPMAGATMDNGKQAAVIYRYNDKTDAICVFHNDGYGSDPESRGLDRSVNEIRLEQYKTSQGLPNALQEGTIYYDALNPINKFKVVKEGNVAKIVNTFGTTINLGNRGIILLREKGNDNKLYRNETEKDGNKEVKVNFRGRQVNPHVKLANTKFLIGAR